MPKCVVLGCILLGVSAHGQEPAVAGLPGPEWQNAPAAWKAEAGSLSITAGNLYISDFNNFAVRMVAQASAYVP